MFPYIPPEFKTILNNPRLIMNYIMGFVY